MGGLAPVLVWSPSKADANFLYDIAIQFSSRITGEERKGFCHALRQRAKDNIPDILLDVMSEWALNDPDPNPTNGRFSSDEFKHEWYQVGINSVRSSAVETVCICALRKPSPQVQRVRDLLTEAIKDSSPAVGACALRGIAMLSDYERGEAIMLAEALIVNHQTLLNDKFTFAHFLNWASFFYPNKFLPFVESMMMNSIDSVRQNGAGMICQSALKNVEAKPLAEIALKGDTFMRIGSADTYARCLRIPEWQSQCEEKLLVLMEDTEKAVLNEVASCFANLSPEALGSLRAFIYRFLDSPALAADTSWHFVQYIKSIAIYDHDLALDAASAILGVLKKSGSFHFWDRDVVSLPLIVYSRSYNDAIQTNAMKLFEEFLRLGLDAARQALETWDDYRNWTFLSD